jgi:hypothetical protein
MLTSLGFYMPMDYKALWRGAVDIEFASGTEDQGSNPAREYVSYGKHSNAVLFN